MQSKTIKWKLAQSIELKWWKNYLGDKNPAEYAIWKKKYWLDLLAKTNSVSFENGMNILDCGCGPAGIFMALPNNVNIDAEDPLLNEYENNLAHFKQSLYPTINFYSQPLEDFEPQKKYDIIFCMNAINHVSNINFCYDKLCSMLKPNGKLVITIDAHNHSFFKHLFRAVPGDVLHPHQYDLTEYNNFLEHRNLTLLQTEKLKSEFFFNHYLQVAIKKAN